MQPTYEMFSPEGNEAVSDVVRYFRKELADTTKYMRTLFEEVKMDYPEVLDTAVRERIYADLHSLLEDVVIDSLDFYDGVVQGINK